MTEAATIERAFQMVAKRRRFLRRKQLLIVAAILIVVLWSAHGTDFNIPQLIVGLPKFFDLLRRMMPPDLSILRSLVWPMIETLEIALIGTTLGVLLAAPLGLLVATNVAPHWLLSATLRVILGTLRTVPELIWAMILVTAVGLGPFPGVLAIMLHTTGALAKWYYEAVEATDPGLIDAVRATGAGRIKVVWYGVLPQAIPVMMSNTLVYWEYNNRASTVLGLVGAGGIGLALTHALQDFRYPEVITCLILIVLILVVIDRFSAYLRARIV
jgi:phosphonate transport system permease protein